MSALYALADQVGEALAALPTSAPEIAALFADLGITGESSHACECPIANYLGAEVKDPSAVLLVSQEEVSVQIEDGDESVEVPMPAHVGTFVGRFDLGDWPNLQRPSAPAPVEMLATFNAVVPA